MVVEGSTLPLQPSLPAHWLAGQEEEEEEEEKERRESLSTPPSGR